MTTPTPTESADQAALLPADDPELASLDLRGLRRRWAQAASRGPIGAEQMTGADLRAQAMGMPGQRLMEHAGAAVGAAVKAIAEATGRWGKGPIIVLAGPGNNGGDGFVAARWLGRAGADVAVALVATAPRPRAPDAARNWDRLDKEPRCPTCGKRRSDTAFRPWTAFTWDRVRFTRSTRTRLGPTAPRMRAQALPAIR